MQVFLQLQFYCTAFLAEFSYACFRFSPQMPPPPHIPSSIPFLGHAVSFGRNPIQFLLKAQEKV